MLPAAIFNGASLCHSLVHLIRCAALVLDSSLQNKENTKHKQMTGWQISFNFAASKQL